MDFFHCNKCYVQPPQTKKYFFLTNCGHSFCEDCANTEDSICGICCRGCKYLTVNRDMPADVKAYFLDIPREMKKLIRILLIQNEHCKTYMEEYVPKLEKKYYEKSVELESLKSNMEKKNKEITLLQNAIQKMKDEVEDMKKQFSRMCQQPVSPSPSVLSPPNSFSSSRSPQSVMFTPKSSPSVNSQLLRFKSRANHESSASVYTSSPYASLEKKRPTAMELFFKNKDSPNRNNPYQDIMQTPRTNQTFNMTINTPERRSRF